MNENLIEEALRATREAAYLRGQYTAGRQSITREELDAAIAGEHRAVVALWKAFYQQQGAPNENFVHAPGPDPDALFREARLTPHAVAARKLRQRATEIRKAMDAAERENGICNAPAQYDDGATQAEIERCRDPYL